MSDTLNMLRDCLISDSDYTRDLEHLDELECQDILSTGLLELDVNMERNVQTGRCGFRYGKIIEFVGQQGTLKTRTTLELAARHLEKPNSFVIWQDSEQAADKEFFTQVLEDAGVDPKLASNIVVQQVQDINSVLINFKRIRDKLAQIEEKERKKPENKNKQSWELVPRVMFVLDSLAGLLSSYDLNSFEAKLQKAADKDAKEEVDDYSAKVGGHAGELHRLFKYVKLPVKLYGMLFVFTNHYRMDLSPSMRKYTPAHDACTKYYISSRLVTSAYHSDGDRRALSKTRSSLGQEYVPGQPLAIEKAKVRASGSIRSFVLDFYYEGGFDYDVAFVDGLQSAGILQKKGSSFAFVDNDFYTKEETDLLDQLFYNKDNKTIYTKAELTEHFNGDPELKAVLEKIAHREGSRSISPRKK